MNQRIHRYRGWLIGLAIVISVYALIGFFLVPYFVRRQIVQRGSEAFHREITLERVYFNPFTFSGTLDQLVISDRGGGDEPLASWEIARVNFDPIESLLRRQWRLGQATLIAPKARIEVEEDATLNIADLFAREDANAPSQPPPFGVDRLVVERGSLDFIDRSLPTDFSTTVDPINFTLEEFATKADAEGAYRLTGSTGRGETFTWTGNVSAVPFASRGRIEFKGMAVPAYQPFVAAYLNGEISSGSLDLSTDYDIGFGGERRASLRGLSLTLANLNIHLPGTEEPVVELPLLQLALREADVFKRTAQVDHITVDRPTVNAVRESGGAFNLVRLFAVADATKKPPVAGASDERSASGGAAPQIRIDRASVQNGSVTLTDRAVSDQPLELRASQINFVASGASTDLAKPIDIEMSVSLQDGPGLLTANGNVTPQPLAAELELSASQIDLAVASPYLQSVVAVERVSGRAELQGSLRASREGDEPMKLQFTGQAGVDEVKATAREFDQAFAQWTHLGIEGAEFALSPLSLKVKKVQLIEPALHAIRGKDGTLNLMTVIGGSAGGNEQAPASKSEEDSAETAEAPKAETQSGSAMAVTIDEFTIGGGNVTFTDQAVEPVVELTLSNLEGTMTKLSTQTGSEGQVRLTGTVVGSAPLNVAGDANVLGPDAFTGSDVTLDLRGVRLEPLEPYVIHFLGYRVQQGRMKGDFEYKLAGGALDGNNHIVLEDFHLGDSVPSPDALNVPIKLALSVLRNSEGNVVLDVPVGGSLTAPNFDFAQTIRSAIGTVLGNVASAPFKFLGSLFGAPDADLSRVEFPPGRAEVTEETNRKLDVLTRALQDRPGLKLMIHWTSPSDVDREGMRQQRLSEMIEQERNRLAADSDETEISDEQVLRSLYVSRMVSEQAEATGDTQVSETAERSQIAAAEENGVPWYTRLWRFIRRAWSDEAEAPEPQPLDVPESAEPLPSEEQMRQDLVASIEVDEGALVDLARSRAETAREQLINAGIAPARVAIADEAEKAPESSPPAAVRFELQLAEPAEAQSVGSEAQDTE